MTMLSRFWQHSKTWSWIHSIYWIIQIEWPSESRMPRHMLYR
jgi:hypothetical protein